MDDIAKLFKVCIAYLKGDPNVTTLMFVEAVTQLGLAAFRIIFAQGVTADAVKASAENKPMLTGDKAIEVMEAYCNRIEAGAQTTLAFAIPWQQLLAGLFAELLKAIGFGGAAAAAAVVEKAEATSEPKPHAKAHGHAHAKKE